MRFYSIQEKVDSLRQEEAELIQEIQRAEEALKEQEANNDSLREQLHVSSVSTHTPPILSHAWDVQ